MPRRSPSPNPRRRKKSANGPSAAELREMFDEVDMDASGTINWFELQLALRSAGQDANKAKEMVAAADTDGDGEIDFDEFVDIINSDFQTDEWLMLSTSLKHRMVKKAKAAYKAVVPVFHPVVHDEYHFPDPEASSHCLKAFFGTWILNIGIHVLGIRHPGVLPFLFFNIAELYFMATQSTTITLRLMGLKFVNMQGKDVGIFFQIFAQMVCFGAFTVLFGIELLFAYFDSESRLLSMQIMGLRFRNISPSPAAKP